MFKRTILVVLILGVWISGLLAQAAVQLHVTDKTIGSKDGVQVTYEFKNITRPAMPDIAFNDWDVNGPSVSQSTQIINGDETSSISYIYTLYPKHIGTLKVPGISFDYNGKKLSCHDEMIKVLQKEHVQKSAQAGNSPFGSLLQGMPNMGFPSDIFGAPDPTPPPVSGVIVHPGEGYDQAAAHDFFIKITPSKSTFYMGEPILVDYEFYGAVNCNWQPERFPSFNGFSVTDIERNLYPYDVRVDGRAYRARGIRKVQLVALKTGDLPLDSASVQVQATFIEANNHADRNMATALIKSKPRHVTVLPLPTAGQPADFSGAIGQFQIRATVDNNKLPAGENNRLHIHITGTGNLDGVTVPDIKWPAGVQAYDAKDSQSVNKTNFPMQRSLDFEVPFIGNKEGGFKIPPIVFNYFNPDTKTYVQDSTDTIEVAFTTPLKDNGVAEGLSQHHHTNRDYLWIVVGIALLVGGIFGVTEWKKTKKAEGKKNTGKADLQRRTGGAYRKTGRTEIAAAAGGEPAPAETPLPQPHTPAPAAHQADHLQYLPEGLSDKIKAKNKLPQMAAETPDQELTLPVKSRVELRQEAMKELRQRLDPKEFFVLAKAFIVEELQYSLQTRDTDEKRLVQSLSERRPELAEEYKALINTCNKALYLPVGAVAVASRQRVLDKLEAL